MKLFDIYGKIGVKGIEGFDSKLKRTHARLEKLNVSMDKVGRIAKRAFIAAGAAIGIAVHQAMKFEKSMANVSTMLRGDALKHMEAYTAGVRRLSTEFGEAKDSLAKGLYDILSASIDAAKAMDVLTVSVMAAKGGMTSAALSADAITTILNSYRMNADKATDVSDKLFAAVLRGKMTYQQLAVGIGKAAATAAIANISLEELLAAVGTITRAGVRPRMAMTAIVGMIRSFLMPTEEASAAARKLGVELSTAALKSEGLLGIFRKLNGLTAEQLALIFPNIRGLKGVAAAMQDLEGFAHDVEMQYNSTGMAQEAFNKVQKTTAYRFDQTKQRIAGMIERIGAGLLPILDKLAKIVEVVEKGFSSMGSTLAGITGKFLAWTAAIGISVYALTKLVKVYVALRKAILGVVAVQGAAAVGGAATAGAGAAGAGAAAAGGGIAISGIGKAMLVAKAAALGLLKAIGAIVAALGLALTAVLAIAAVVGYVIYKGIKRSAAAMKRFEESSKKTASHYGGIAKHIERIGKLEAGPQTISTRAEILREEIARQKAIAAKHGTTARELGADVQEEWKQGPLWGESREAFQARIGFMVKQGEQAKRLADMAKLRASYMGDELKVALEQLRAEEKRLKIMEQQKIIAAWTERARVAAGGLLAGPAGRAFAATEAFKEQGKKDAEAYSKSWEELGPSNLKTMWGLVKAYTKVGAIRKKILGEQLGDIETARRKEIDMYVKTGLEKQRMEARLRTQELLDLAKTEEERKSIRRRGAAEISKINNQARADDARRFHEDLRKYYGPKIEVAQKQIAARGGLAETFARTFMSSMQLQRRESDRMLADMATKFGTDSPEYRAAQQIADKQLQVARDAGREPAGQWKGLAQVWKDLQTAAVKTPEQELGEQSLNVLKELNKKQDEAIAVEKQMLEQLKTSRIAVAG